MKDWLNRCHFGDVRQVLRRMITDGVKVNTIITSPPYWGLRSYLPDDHPDKALEIGSEATIHEFIAGMVEVFDLAREVLADDGTCWVNMGDSYAGSWGAQGREGGGRVSDLSATQVNAAPKGRRTGSMARVPGLKPKDLVGQPWRLALALQDAGWWLRSDIIWNKPNPMPESTRDRPTKAHEYLFLLAKSEQYYFDFEAWKEPVSGGARPRRASNGVGFGHGFDASPRPRALAQPSGWATGATGRAHDELIGRYPSPKAALAGFDTGDAYADGKSDRLGRGPGWRVKNNESMDAALASLPTTRNRRTVWTIPTEAYRGAHFATFPQKLVEPCILAGCPVGGAVLDIFFGTGTVGKVAKRLGRGFIGIDLNRANDPLQRDRIGAQDAFHLEVVHA